MISDYFDKTKVSLYQPSDKEREITLYAKEAYEKGNRILTQSWPELNNKTILEDEQNGKKIFNAFVDESDDDPFEAWKWKGTRSEARKKAVGMHAALTAGFLFPGISAQDENDREDRAAGDFMRELVVWMCKNSNYKSSFIQVVMGMLTNPVTYLGAEYAEVFQKIKEKTEKGYEIKEVLDEELSGFRVPVYGSGDILIGNAYEQNIQRQTFVIKKRFLDYNDAKKKYGKHQNWIFVQRGISSVFNENDGTFYDVYDPENSERVQETFCSWRSEDLEVPFLGGVYMGDENTEDNPFKSRTLENNPIYNIVPFGYSRISEHFFYFKSLMSSLQWEDNLIDELYRVMMNRNFLDLIQPSVLKGFESSEINTSVVFPGSQVVTPNINAKIEPILSPASGNPYAAIQTVEKSMEESSIADINMGQLPPASQKATSVVQAVRSGKTLLKGVSQTLGESIVQFGKLLVSNAVRHLSVPEMREITGGGFDAHYRQFLLANEVSQGKRISKLLRFDGNLVGKEMNKRDKDLYELKLAEEAGYPETKSTILAMNPEFAPRLKYLIYYDPEEMFENNREQMQIIFQNMYAQLRQDPLINAPNFLREYLYAFFKSKGEDLLVENPEEILKTLQTAQLSPIKNNLPMPTPVATPSGMV